MATDAMTGGSPRSRGPMAFLTAAAVFIVAATGWWAVMVEPDRIVERTLVVVPPRWPADLPPVRIAFLSDLHIGAPHFDLPRLKEVVDRVNAWRPDVVLLGGDYVVRGVLGGSPVAPEDVAAELGKLQSPHGIVAVLGNHDWWLDGHRVRRALEAEGVVVLENAAHPAGPLWIAGLADDTTREPDARRAMLEILPDAAFVVLMHDPANLPDVSRFASLVLAGHTHGGQVRLPWIGSPIVPGRAPRDHAYGFVREAGQTMYVTSGLGTSILPIRFGMPPEIVFIHLGGVAAPPP